MVETGEGFLDSRGWWVRSGDSRVFTAITSGLKRLMTISCDTTSSALRFSVSLISACCFVGSIETRLGAFPSNSVIATAAIIAMRSSDSWIGFAMAIDVDFSSSVGIIRVASSETQRGDDAAGAVTGTVGGYFS